MIVIVGLGNPGPEYEHTRHNAGRMLVESLRQQWQTNQEWRSPQDIQGLAEVWKGQDRILVIPKTYMNETGAAVQAVLHWFKVPLTQLIVAYDDLDIALGSYKLQWATGPKVHNGVLSLQQHLGSLDFWHVRLGVDSRNGDRRQAGADYVLGNFSPEQTETLNKTLAEVQASVEELCATL